MPTTLKTINWNAKDFLALMRSLSEIPPHFYMLSEQQKAQRDKTDLAVVDVPEKFAKHEGHIPFKECYCNENAKRPRVIVIKSALNSRTIVHDLAHRFTDDSLDTLSKEFFDILSVKTFQDIEVKFADSKIVLGLAIIDIREFFSVAAEYYVQSKGLFTKVYKKFLGEKDTEALYEFMKDKIFLGKEAPSKKSRN